MELKRSEKSTSIADNLKNLITNKLHLQHGQKSQSFAITLANDMKG